jgi:hypothetical protein
VTGLGKRIASGLSPILLLVLLTFNVQKFQDICEQRFAHKAINSRTSRTSNLFCSAPIAQVPFLPTAALQLTKRRKRNQRRIHQIGADGVPFFPLGSSRQSSFSSSALQPSFALTNHTTIWRVVYLCDYSIQSDQALDFVRL